MKNFREILTRSVLVILVATPWISQNAHAGDKDCWGDFYEESQYSGKHFRLQGPAKLEKLNDVDGADWNRRIHSLKVGPKAKVTVYQNPKFQLTLTEMAKSPEQMQALGITEQDIKEDSELIFTENSNIHDLGDFAFHKKIRSLKIDCI